MGNSTAGVPPRVLAPDIARGGMLLLIALANVSWYLWGRPAVALDPHPGPVGPLDATLQFLMSVAVDARALPMFAFLFGYGMVQFTRSRERRGVPGPEIARLLRRRHLAMILIGAVHAVLLFLGDILAPYGAIGLVLVALLLHRSDRTLLRCILLWVTAVGLLSIAVAVLGAAALLDPHPARSALVVWASQDSGALRDLAVGPVPWTASIGPRLATWFQQGLVLGVLVVPPVLMTGWLAARHGLLDEPSRHAVLLRRVALFGIGIGWAGGLISAVVGAGLTPLPESGTWAFQGVDELTGMAAGIGYAAVFGLVAARLDGSTGGQRRRLPWIWRALAAVGARSLTFYLWQSVVFAPLLAGWGFGLGGRIDTPQALGIAGVVWACSLPAAMWLEARGRRGPAEVLLRRLVGAPRV